MSALALIICIPIGGLLLGYAFLVLATFVLAEWTRQRGKFQDSQSAMYSGRVSHSRMQPKKHSFSYPIFMMLVDLEDDFQNVLFPLSSIMSLRPADHYKNNEGSPESISNHKSLLERTFSLVAQRTEQKFKPSVETHSVKLLTHLSYFGYCFNPVSFYYILDRETKKIDTVVAEVSNTPWNEMQCYVLHKESVDMKEVKEGRPKKELEGTNYIFQKTFHVSPFMDMQHLYDWTFWEFTKEMDPLCVNNSMVKEGILFFSAYLQIQNVGLHPHTLAKKLVLFPIFCFLVQIWIHYEAFRLFFKGVAFVPHPKGSETAASRVIGKMMAPLFALQDWVDEKFKKNK